MRIESYKFGKMVVEGVSYDFDLIITPEKVIPNWWRKDGHQLHREDLEEITDQAPAQLVIGNGAQGVMEVPDEVVDSLEEMGFSVLVERTNKAVQSYNKMIESPESPVIGAFHLTC